MSFTVLLPCYLIVDCTVDFFVGTSIVHNIVLHLVTSFALLLSSFWNFDIALVRKKLVATVIPYNCTADVFSLI